MVRAFFCPGNEFNKHRHEKAAMVYKVACMRHMASFVQMHFAVRQTAGNTRHFGGCLRSVFGEIWKFMSETLPDCPLTS